MRIIIHSRKLLGPIVIRIFNVPITMKSNNIMISLPGGATQVALIDYFCEDIVSVKTSNLAFNPQI